MYCTLYMYMYILRLKISKEAQSMRDLRWWSASSHFYAGYVHFIEYGLKLYFIEFHVNSYQIFTGANVIQ